MDGGCQWDATTSGWCMMKTRRRLTKAEKQNVRRRLETKTKTPKYTDKDFPGFLRQYRIQWQRPHLRSFFVPPLPSGIPIEPQYSQVLAVDIDD